MRQMMRLLVESANVQWTVVAGINSGHPTAASVDLDRLFLRQTSRNCMTTYWDYDPVSCEEVPGIFTQPKPGRFVKFA